nr:Ycf12 [Erythrotrichia welwitschii]
MGNILTGINWQVIAQLVSLGVIVLLGPVVIVLLSFRKGNL